MPFSLNFLALVRPFFAYSLLTLIMLSTSRLLLAIWQTERVAHLESYIDILINGIRVDLSTTAYLILLPALIHPFIMMSALANKWLKLLQTWFLLGLCFLLFMELSTPAFIMEYDLRPNRLFVEYLIYPKEVFSMLMAGHKIEMLFSLLGLTLGGYISWTLIVKTTKPSTNTDASIKTTLPTAIFTSIFLIVFLLLAARGTLGHRPLNPSLVYFSTDPLINSLTLNSTYSVAFAVKQMKNEKNAARLYGKMDESKVFDIVKQEMELAPNAFVNDAIPTLARKEVFYQGKPKSLVIVLEESLGAQFVGSLGGTGLTPELDKLMDQGWSFDNLYATGTRSVRGIEAVITGFTPTPARSVVKLDKSQQNFFTIAQLLKNQGYSTQFVYGGESHFDNMKSFFLGNGFTSLIDFDDIINPQFVGPWGASDEDLFTQANKELIKLAQQDQPFFSLIFSSSNHDPFEIPEGKITAQENDTPRDKAIRYADFALGKFIEQAKKEEYYQNTVFLVVADHDARVFGAELVPIKSFHIPGVILNSTMNSNKDKRIVSQIDLAPTLLSLIGIAEPTPMIGFDLTREHKKERAMMQFANNFAYMSNKKVAILRPNKPGSYFNYDLKDKQLTPAAENIMLGKEALAHALFGSIAYDKQLFRLP